MTVQNGLGAEEVVGAHGELAAALGGHVHERHAHGDTHVEYILDTETWIGPYRDTTPADARAVADADRLAPA